MNHWKNKDLKAFVNSIPEKYAQQKMKEQAEENARVYKEFKDALDKGECFLCKGKMDELDITVPCFHWFTYPNGIKKKHFTHYLKNPIGFFQLDSYFRWLANTEKPLGNINDLKDETSETSYLESTYKYKNLEWAFSVGNTDLEGHEGGKVGGEPHYHIQMKVGDLVFLKFNDFHIPFSDPDLFNIELLNQAGDKVKLGHSYGQGMGVLEDEDMLEIIDNSTQTTDDYENATFNRQTLIYAPDGISGDLIADAFEESKKTKEPVGKIIQRMLKDQEIKCTTIISPGEGVPKMSKRSGKK